MALHPWQQGPDGAVAAVQGGDSRPTPRGMRGPGPRHRDGVAGPALGAGDLGAALRRSQLGSSRMMQLDRCHKLQGTGRLGLRD